MNRKKYKIKSRIQINFPLFFIFLKKMSSDKNTISPPETTLQINPPSLVDKPQISNQPNYSEMNQLYKELYEERQQRKNQKSKNEETKNSEIKPQVVSVSVPAQLITSYLSLSNQKPHFYVNKLSHYPKTN